MILWRLKDVVFNEVCKAAESVHIGTSTKMNKFNKLKQRRVDEVFDQIVLIPHSINE